MVLNLSWPAVSQKSTSTSLAPALVRYRYSVSAYVDSCCGA